MNKKAKERIRRSDTRQRQERNDDAAHVQVRTQIANKSSRCPNRSGCVNKEQPAALFSEADCLTAF